MGIFDGILICSDWDGTLYNGSTVPAVSQNAIEYFMSEGGKFSITSGRGPDFLIEQTHLVYPNTYCICYGGALITDIKIGEIVRRGGCNYDAFKVVDRILGSGASITRINVFTEGEIIRFTAEDYLKGDFTIPEHIYKIAINGETDADGEIFARLATDWSNEDYTLARSFSSYVEIMKTEFTKGISARVLKEKVGARVLVGMGDYENDLPLFEECDVSFAVGNAIEKTKRAADFVTEKTVYNGAVAEIIDTIEKKIKGKKL